jgi:PAT family beta-lactamase induction signal transducer AmpG
MLALLAMAAFTPGSLQAFIWAAVAVAFFGATQDIAVDAYRIEIAPESAQGALVATYALGYRIGLIIAGAFAAIMADHVAWPLVYVAMAACMLSPVAANLLAREPDVIPVKTQGWLHAMQLAVIDPFVDFFRRYGIVLALMLLGFILLFKVPEQATIGGIMSPFYRDMGFNKTQIGSIAKGYGIWMGIVGVFVGGAMVARWGAWKSLGMMIVVCGACNLLYLVLMHHHGDLWMLTAVISAQNFTLGMLGPPTVAFLSGLVSREHTAMQYALLSSLVNLPGKLLGFFSGAIVMATGSGYGVYFVITVLALLPAVMLYAWLTPKLRARAL